MNGLRLALHDIRQMWSSHILRRSVLGLMVLPLMYSFIYLWAFWNPTDFLARLPLAVVNLDKGYTSEGVHVNLGHDLTAKLTKDTTTHWKEVPEQDALKGVETLEYFMAVVIPPDFSQKAYSAGTSKPEHTSLAYHINEGGNMLGAKVVRNIMDKVKGSLEHELTTRYLQVLFDTVAQGGSGLQKAADGASQLATGLGQAQTGSIALTNGLQESGKGMDQLATGLGQLTNGANQIENGIIRLDTVASLAAGGVNNASKATDSVLAHSQSLASDLSKLTQTLTHSLDTIESHLDRSLMLLDTIPPVVTPVKERLQEHRNKLQNVTSNVQNVLQAHPELASDPAFQKLETAVNQVQTNQSNLESDITQLNNQNTMLYNSLRQDLKQSKQDTIALRNSIQQLNSRLQDTQNKLNQDMALLAALPAQLQSLAANIHKLQEGSTALVNGLQTFSTGFNRLRDGNTKLLDGSQQLQSGLTQLHTGASQLAQKLGEAAGMAKQDGKQDERIAVIADPVISTEQNTHPVPNNGTGFAPYFIALSLWVGSLVLFFVIDLQTVSSMPKRPISYMTNKYLALASVSIFQAILSVFILNTGLGVQTTMPPLLLYGFAIIIGLCYTALLFMLLSVLGNDVGRFAAVLILMLQLTSSSGSYPVELEPSFFHFIQPFLPMSYSVEGLRNVISVGNLSIIQTDAIVLCLFGLGSLLLLYIIKRKRILQEINTTH